MITEDYVSFEVAKLLKEKGFGEPCFYYYKDKVLMFSPILKGRNLYQTDTYSAPTLQMVMKWLRIEHNILLFLLPAQENGKLVYLVKVWTWNEEEGIYESTYAPMPRKEPEQAIEAALKYSLKNLV
jgi:hypothetical protein